MVRTKKKRKNAKKKEDSFIYTLLLLIVTILMITLNKILVGLGIFILPILIFITNYIIKKYNFKEAIFGIVISLLSIVMYLFMLFNLLNRVISLFDVFHELIAFITCFVVNCFIYKEILEKNKEKKYIIINYIFSINVYALIYILFKLI